MHHERRRGARSSAIAWAIAAVGLASLEGPSTAWPSTPALQEQGDALMKNVEEMLAHGGMGDAKAIVHHCEEAARYAENLKRLSEQDPMLHAPLNEVIRQCRRVSQIGIHADPGLLLNPAAKARAAARESLKALGLTKPTKS
jgi:hypothetical protein